MAINADKKKKLAELLAKRRAATADEGTSNVLNQVCSSFEESKPFQG